LDMGEGGICSVKAGKYVFKKMVKGEEAEKN
jgi:hypothetical protein